MLSRYQLERADLDITIEQGRRVELAQFEESHRNMQTMGELLKARVFSSTEYALSMRKRMTDYMREGATVRETALPEGRVTGQGPSRHATPSLALSDPHPDHGVLCDCPDCDEAVKRLLRDVGVLPKGAKDYSDYTIEPIVGPLKIPVRYRRDESDR